ncbi:hypothetical protein ASG11_07595 [Sphingomonas sp. Leaf357]|uniref:alpha/beta fold hydrolase n=1 Tax=Sphingomonas sp. Leaf357 TaxID=1736350 RepID=UPI0006FEB3A5|nr:alpha/beta fold hydrolase [Sphingomonas sp. Leaf357]KQS04125.1 hypothetical protein ASG11_07595 [Sphingomonas sp. Leaf357]
MRISRRFLQVGERRVHYFRAGDGPPAVLIHSSPANARLLFKEIERLSPDLTIFAFDTPGFGLSDPLPLATMTVADLADAMADTLAAIAMPCCPVFGTHTGAAIALELGVRHPDRVTGLVLDGVPAFTDAECAVFFRDYFRALPVSDLGGHYAETWTRFRDQSIWFPWSERIPEHLNPYDLSPPHSTHLWVAMYFEAAEHYAPAYKAASFYGARAIAATRELSVPAIFTATDTDMLYPHLERLPPLKDGQEIVEIGNSFERKRTLIAEAFARYGARGPAPADPDTIASETGIARQFVDGAHGQVHVRHAGDRAHPPLLLVHDAPGSSEQAEPLIARLATRFFVVAPDLPGSGDSDALPDTPAIDDFADVLAGVLNLLGVASATLYGIGFGSSVALAMAGRHPGKVAMLALQGVLLPDEAERRAMRAGYAPPIEIVADGSHWYRTWLMLRDTQIYWPWYDRRLAALRRVAADFSARPLHRWTMDVMRGRERYGDAIHAALDHDAAAALSTIDRPLIRVIDPSTPLSAHDDRLAALCRDKPVLQASSADFAAELATIVAMV